MAHKIRLPDMNQVSVVGRLTRDPELRFTPKGDAVCRIDLAINRNYKGVNGEWKEETSFIPVVVWRDAATRCNERLKKGFPVFVTGRLKSRQWEDKEGKKRTVVEVQAQKVQFLQSNEEDPAAPGKAAAPDKSEDAPVEAAAASSENDEEIPF